jgi:hypothetical protein
VTFKLGTLGLAVARLLVDVNLVAVDWVALGSWAAVFVDAHLFLLLLLRLLVVDGGREGCVRLFVTFPSVCLFLR